MRRSGILAKLERFLDYTVAIGLVWAAIIYFFIKGKENVQSKLSGEQDLVTEETMSPQTLDSSSSRNHQNTPNLPNTPKQPPRITVKEVAKYDSKVKETLDAATRWFGNADPSAQYYIGWMYDHGAEGVTQDDGQAVRWYQKAAENGSMSALNNLAWFYEKGRGGLPKDDVRAATFYRIAADAGEPYAQRNLGFMYQQGRGGLPRSQSKAQLWFDKAAAQGVTSN